MKIVEVVGDMRVMWFNKRGNIEYKRYKPPLKIPLPTEIQVGKPKDLPTAKNCISETLPGYYVIGTDGRLVKVNEIKEFT